jgi:hypothetical protein
MMSRTDKMLADNIRATYMKEYRKRKRLEEDNYNNVPKRTKLHVERQHEYRGTHLLNTCVKAQENKTPQASTSTDPTPTPIIYNYNQANEYFQKNFIGNPFGYACNV